MSRVGAIFWLGLAMTACVVMFMINYAVQSLQNDLNKLRRQTVAEQLKIRVLHAEWSYLTQPERLAELNQQFLSLTPIATKQLQQTIADIPLRPIAEPPAEETAAGAPVPAPAGGLEFSAAASSARDLDGLFAQASDAEPPAATLPATPVALTTPVRPGAANPGSTEPGLDALFARVATGR